MSVELTPLVMLIVECLEATDVTPGDDDRDRRQRVIDLPYVRFSARAQQPAGARESAEKVKEVLRSVGYDNVELRPVDDQVAHLLVRQQDASVRIVVRSDKEGELRVLTLPIVESPARA